MGIPTKAPHLYTTLPGRMIGGGLHRVSLTLLFRDNPYSEILDNTRHPPHDSIRFDYDSEGCYPMLKRLSESFVCVCVCVKSTK